MYSALKLSPMQKGTEIYENCDPLIIHIKYEGESWFSLHRKTRSNYVTEEKHKEAITFIKKAWKKKIEIHFGYMGTGLVPVDNAASCEVKIKGIMFTPENSITAFHNAI